MQRNLLNKKEIKKNRQYAHKVKCELCRKTFLSKIKFEEHVKEDHTEEKDEENTFVNKESKNKICVHEHST